MNQLFTFVDGTKTDRVTRRLARSHAMKGKNAGKTHEPRSVRRARATGGGQSNPRGCRSLALLQKMIPSSPRSEEVTIRLEENISQSSGQTIIYRSLQTPLPVDPTPWSLDVIENCT